MASVLASTMLLLLCSWYESVFAMGLCVCVCVLTGVYLCLLGDPCSVLVSCSEGKRSALTAGHREHLRLFVYIPAGCHHLLRSLWCTTTCYLTHNHQSIHVIYNFQSHQRLAFAMCYFVRGVWWRFASKALHSASSSDI